MKKESALLVAGTAALTGLAAYALHAYADGAPTSKPLFYSGTLEANGKLASGAHTVALTLYDAEQAGKPLCSSETVNTPVEGGRFRVEVSAECVAAMKANPEVWASLRFTGPDGVPHELPLRSKVGAVPYALEAQHAVSATNAINATNATNASAAASAQRATYAADAGLATSVAASSVRVASGSDVCVACGTGCVDCSCAANEVAISGGAFSGASNNTLNASQQGASIGLSPRVWRVACLNPSGARVDCAAPFAVCLRVQ